MEKPTEPSLSYYKYQNQELKEEIDRLEKAHERIMPLFALSIVASVVLFVLVASLWGK